MEFALTDEQAMIADTASSFFDEQADSPRVREAMERHRGIDRELWQSFGHELGLAGVTVPEAHGGAELGMVELALVAEAAGKRVAALPLLASVAIGAQAVLKGGSVDQRERLLPGIASGETIATLVSGDFSVRDGRITGTAPFVIHGDIAGMLIVEADDGLHIVDSDAQGVEITPLVSLDQTRPFARVAFTDAPGEALADGPAGLQAAHAAAWLAVAADSLGGAQACLERTVTYSKERVQFGRIIGSFQAVKHRLADMMIEIEQARSAVLWAALSMDEQSDDARMALHSAKAFASECYAMCAGNMIQLHGGIAFTWEHDAHLYFKRARANLSAFGSPDWHREQVAQIIGLGEAA